MAVEQQWNEGLRLTLTSGPLQLRSRLWSVILLLLLANGFHWFRWRPWFFVLYIAGVVATLALLS